MEKSMKLVMKYMVCFLDQKMLQTDETNRFAHVTTFDESRTFDTKLEALEYLRVNGDEEHTYTIVEIIQAWERDE